MLKEVRILMQKRSTDKNSTNWVWYAIDEMIDKSMSWSGT